MPQTLKHVEVYFIAQSLCVILNLHVHYQKKKHHNEISELSQRKKQSNIHVLTI